MKQGNELDDLAKALPVGNFRKTNAIPWDVL